MQLKEDEIISIEYIGEEETADVEILDAEGEHQRNYFANGFNVHNSGAMAQYSGLKHGSIKKDVSGHKIVAEETGYTYGLIIYQEQVMQVVRRLAGFDWAQTNEIRKVMSKTGGAEYFMTHYWPPFRDGCASKNNVSEEDALKIFKRVMSMGSWCMNLSHAVSYAFVSYLCMWFKVKYPIEYCTAYLNYVNDTDGNNIKQMIGEINRLGIKLREADINKSGSKFIIDDGSIVASLSDIKNVGDKAVETVVANRPYKSLIDFLSKIDKRACNSRSVRNLIQAGAFDTFGYDVFKLLSGEEKKTMLDEIIKQVKKGTDKSLTAAKNIDAECRIKGAKSYTDQQMAQMKINVTPVAVGKHISQYYDDVVSKFASHIRMTKLVEVELDESAQSDMQGVQRTTKRLDVNMVGLVTSIDLKRLSQEVKELIDKGEEERYALANMEDGSDFIVLSFKKGVYTRYEQQLFSFKNKVMMVKGTVNKGFKKCFVDKIFEMDKVREYMVNGRKPYNFDMDCYFQHPLERCFEKVGGVKKIKRKYGCINLKDVRLLGDGDSIWAMGIITDIQDFKLKKGDHAGEKFHWAFFSDETFEASFMIFPGDKRFDVMKKDLFELYEKKLPFMLYIQRDMQFKEGDQQFKQVSLSLDKRISWDKIIKKPFTFKGR
jgi:DNA polymerase III alpha subunit